MLFQELIQNAEDAGAQQIKFLYDGTHYPSSRLHHHSMAHFQVRTLNHSTKQIYRIWPYHCSIIRLCSIDRPPYNVCYVISAYAQLSPSLLKSADVGTVIRHTVVKHTSPDYCLYPISRLTSIHHRSLYYSMQYLTLHSLVLHQSDTTCTKELQHMEKAPRLKRALCLKLAPWG